MKDSVFAILTVLLVVAWFIAGMLEGRDRERKRWHEEAVMRGVAGYNETTGEWQWKPVAEEPNDAD